MSEYVTRAEFERVCTDTKIELTIIKNALVGTDMRDGLVGDVADIKKQIDGLDKTVKDMEDKRIIQEKIDTEFNNKKEIIKYEMGWQLKTTIASLVIANIFSMIIAVM
jgi:tetrahydromethanopterin S-methyltransferase subunit B